MISNAQLLKEVIRAKELNKVTHELATMWVEMIDHRLKSPNYMGFTWNREDVKSEALIVLCRIGLNFDTTKSTNPFAYYMSSIIGSFCTHLAREKRQNDIKDTLNGENVL
jgi:hypothetical protein